MPKSSLRGAANSLRLLQIVLMVLLQLALPMQAITTASAAEQAAPAAVVASAPAQEPLDQGTVKPGICSNAETKACATSADCGGSTCYLPTDGGQTLDNQVCMQQAAGFGIQCTANDVRIADTSNLVIVDGCSFPGDTAEISFVAEFELTAQDRYDIGVWVAQDGGNALTGKCSVSDFPTAPTPPWTNLDADAQPTDTCGDITSANNPLYSSVQTIKVECNDTNGDGNLDINTCLSWRQSGANDVCTSPLQAFPGSPSKCNCQKLPGIEIPVPGVIKVDKVTYQADGTTLKPGDPTSFPFALSGPVDKSFSLKDADAPWSSGGLTLGTYSVAESVPAGWQLMGATCTSDQAGRSPTPGNIVLHSGETVTCTFKDKVTPAPAISLSKQIGTSATGPWSSSVTVPGGSSVYYKFTVTNSGNVALSSIGVTDPKVSTAGCSFTNPLPAGQSTSCVVGPITAATAAGTYPNTATAHGSYGGTAYTSQPSSAEYIVAAAPAIKLDKRASTPTYDHVGQLVGYTLVATNVGNVTLTNVTIADPKLGSLVLQGTETACGAASLASGASITCTGSHSISQADLDAGSFTNTATATGVYGDQTVSADDSVTINADQNPALSLEKSASPTTYSTVGQQIAYTYVLTNTGNVTLQAPYSVTDDKATVTCPTTPPTLGPGDKVTCTATHTITQADLDAGKVTNLATATAKHGGNTVTSNQATATVTAVKNPALSITKAATEDSFDAVGDVIHYTIVAKNVGNVTLPAVTVTDPLVTGLSCTPANGSPLAPGASMTCTATHTVTQADLDAGHWANQACADDGQNGAEKVCADKDVPGEQNPHISLEKSVLESSFTKAGDILHYTLVATNDGDVTLTNVTISDSKLGTLTCNKPAPVTLKPGETLSCMGSYTVLQSDVDAGHVANTATATGTPPKGPNVTDTDSKDVPAGSVPSIDLTKVATPHFGDPPKPGDKITYELVATNDDDVTLHDVTIADPKLGTLTCTPSQPAVLAPTEKLTCTGSYSLTQADIDAGKVDNTAIVTSKLPTGATGPSDEASARVLVPQKPALSIVKSADPTTYDSVGDVVHYTIVATNVGNVTLDGVTISDPMFASLTCTPEQPATLAPAATLTCTGSHTITQADLDAGHVANTACVDDGQNGAEKVCADKDVLGEQHPHISLTKTPDLTSFNAVGQVITYTLVATNDSNVTLHDVSIADPKLGELTCTPAQPATLAPNAKLSCTGSHTVAQADLDAGEYNNTATVNGKGPQDQPVSATANATVPAIQSQSLSLTKVAAETSFGAVGDVIHYTIVAKNVGNTTLATVTVTDSMVTDLACTPENGSALAPGESMTCTATHTVTQDDLDAGHWLNIACVDDGEGGVEKVCGDRELPSTATRTLSLDKTASPGTYSKVGDVINYSYKLTNTGDVNLPGPFSIVDDKTTATCPSTPATLAMGASITCTATYTIKQADLDAGKVTNVAYGLAGTIRSNNDSETVYRIAVLPKTGSAGTLPVGIVLFALSLVIVGLRLRLRPLGRLVRSD